MKITEISVRRVKNLGNYESLAMEFTASVDERAINDAVGDLNTLLDYHLNKDEREKMRDKLAKEYDSPKTTDDRRIEIDTWMERLSKLETDVVAIEASAK
jgi:hypothetical protein